MTHTTYKRSFPAIRGAASFAQKRRLSGLNVEAKKAKDGFVVLWSCGFIRPRKVVDLDLTGDDE